MRNIFLTIMLALTSVVSLNAQNSDNQIFSLFFNEALKYRLDGNYQKAIEMYLQCYRLDNTTASVPFEIARIFQTCNDNKNADKFIDIALQNDSNNNVTYIETAIDIKLSLHEYADCLPLFDKLLEKDNTDVNNHLVAAKVAIASDQCERALEYLESTPDKEQYSDYIIPIKFNAYMSMDGGLKKAYKYVNSLYKKNPKNAKYNFYLANYYFTIHEEKNGLKYLESASTCDRGDIYLFDLADYYLVHQQFDEFYDRAEKAYSSNMIDSEVKYNKIYYSLTNKLPIPNSEEGIKFYTMTFDTLLSQYPDDAKFYALYSDFASSCNDLDKSLELLEKLHDMDGLDAETWRNYLLRLASDGQNDRELEYSEEALLKYPDDPFILLLNGECYLIKKDYQKAITPLRHCYSILSPINNEQVNSIKVAVMNDLATSYFYVDSADNSFAYYEEILKIDPYNAGALNNYSYYLTLKGMDLDKAESMSKKTLDISPGNATYLDTYAWVLYNKGIYIEAKFLLEQALGYQTEPSDEMLDHYGDVLYRLGYIDQAVEQWQKSYDISNSEETKRKIDAKAIIE